MNLPTKIPYELMLTKWASILNPVIANPMVQGLQLQNVSIRSGVNVINHKLGKKMQGWILTDTNAAATVYRSAPFNDKTLSLTSDADAMVSIWVY